MSERAKKIARRGDGNELRLIYDTYLDNTSHVNNWDLVDISCGPIVGGYLLDRDRSPLYELARSDLLWDRRIAMVGSQRFLPRGETSDLYRLAEILLPDRHDLIHKAVGWSLREARSRSMLTNCVASLISARDHASYGAALRNRAFRCCRAPALPHPPADTGSQRYAETEGLAFVSSAAAGYPATSPSRGPARSGSGDAPRRSRKDAFLVTGTTRVRDVVELFIELNGGLGCAVLEASQAARNRRAASRRQAPCRRRRRGLPARFSPTMRRPAGCR